MKTHVNLLPMVYRRKQLIVRCARQWSAIWFIALSGVGVLYWMQHTQNHRARARLESLRREHAPAKLLAEEVEALRLKIDELRHRESIVLSLADEQSVLTLVGLLSRATLQCEGKLCIQRLQLNRRQDNGQHFTKVLQLDGIAVDNHLVARFAAALRDTAAFQRVELKSSGRRGGDEPAAQVYSLECFF
jgi:hypothetical protein